MKKVIIGLLILIVILIVYGLFNKDPLVHRTNKSLDETDLAIYQPNYIRANNRLNLTEWLQEIEDIETAEMHSLSTLYKAKLDSFRKAEFPNIRANYFLTLKETFQPDLDVTIKGSEYDTLIFKFRGINLDMYRADSAKSERLFSGFEDAIIKMRFKFVQWKNQNGIVIYTPIR